MLVGDDVREYFGVENLLVYDTLNELLEGEVVEIVLELEQHFRTANGYARVDQVVAELNSLWKFKC